MTNLEEVYNTIKTNRQNIKEGKINGIPFAIPQFRDCLPTIQKGQYHLLSAKTKGGKTQIASELFLYNAILYAYQNPKLLRVKFLYFNWEESNEELMLRFMSYCLYKFTNHKIRVSPMILKSPDEKHLLDDETLSVLESDKFKNLFKFFDEHVEFHSDDRSTVAVDIAVKNYAKANGEFVYKNKTIKEDGLEKEIRITDKYIPKDPDEYVFVLIDHVSLISPIQSQNLLQAIGNLSKQCVYYKNMLKYIPVIVQQQSKELGGLEANKQGRIRPDAAFLSDCKSTINECTQFWGICDPYSDSLKEYLGYDLTRLGHNFRVLELVVNRSGEGGKMVPLFFDGAVNYFTPMPSPYDKENLDKFYKHINEIKEKKEEKMKISYAFLTFAKRLFN